MLTVEGLLFFFFQAEDGIRDADVTGVQTCALPISAGGRPFLHAIAHQDGTGAAFGAGWGFGNGHYGRCGGRLCGSSRLSGRSEERRVGKECRSRGSPYHYTKKTR